MRKIILLALMLFTLQISVASTGMGFTDVNPPPEIQELTQQDSTFVVVEFNVAQVPQFSTEQINVTDSLQTFNTGFIFYKSTITKEKSIAQRQYTLSNLLIYNYRRSATNSYKLINDNYSGFNSTAGGLPWLQSSTKQKVNFFHILT